MERGSTTVLFIYFVLAFSALALIYLLVPAETVKLIFLPSVAAVAMVGALLVVFHVVSPHEKLKRRLRKMSTLVLHEPAEVLKDLYMEIYNLYLRLSHRHQKKYYPHVMGIRKKLEEGMHAEQILETLFIKADKQNMIELKKTYDELYVHFKKLPQKLQGKYYAHLVHLRQKLENGE